MSIAADGLRLGVDFGTSNTVAVLAAPGGSVAPLLFDGSPLLSSAVCADGSGALLTGRDAVHAARVYPAGFEPNPKQRIDDGSVLLNGSEVAVVDTIGAVLRRVGGEARAVAGSAPGSVTLTCPAAWGARRRDVLTMAADRAGLPAASLVAEPVAAASYFVHLAAVQVPTGACAVVYDFGAGTFDASVVRSTVEGFDVLAAVGLPDAGGLDVDSAIVAYLGATYAHRDPVAWRRLTEPATPADRRLARMLWDDVRTAKEMLSRSAATMVHVPLLDVDAPLGREQFEQLARPILDRTVAATRAAMLEADVNADQIAGLFLVGGSSRIPLAATLLHRGLGVAPVVLDKPELVVAEGSLRIPTSPATTSAHVPRFTARAPVAVSAAAATRAVAPTPADHDRPGRRTAPRLPRLSGHRRWLIPAVLVLVLAAGLLVRTILQTDPPPDTEGPHLAGHTGPVTALAYSPDGRTLASGSDDRTVRLWNVANRRPLGGALEGQRNSATSVAFSPDGRTLASAGQDGIIRLWDAAGPRLIETPLANDTYAVNCVVFSPDGRTLASASRDFTIRFWDVAGRRLSGGSLDGHTGSVWSAAFSPDGRVLASAAQDGTVRLWDVATRRQIGDRLTGHTNAVHTVAFSPDGRLLASAGADHTIRFWDPATGRPDGEPLTGHIDLVSAVVFSPDGRTLASASHDRTVRLWDVASRRQSGEPLTDHTAAVYALAFAPDGRTLASGGFDRTIRLWDLASRQK